MKLIDALRIVNEAAREARPPEKVFLVCGFTPLHLQTFLAARLQQRSAQSRIVVDTGLFGDVAGSLERAAAERPAAAIVLLEWSDVDARLGARTTGGWSPAMEPDVIESARGALARIESRIVTLAESTPTIVCFPTLPLLPIAHTTGWQAASFELALRAALAETGARIAMLPRVRVVSQQRLDLLSPMTDRADLRAETTTGFPYAQAHAERLALCVSELLRPVAPKKGLITDLDDTLWRGILGEVGVDGITWALDRRAHVHALYQQMLSSLADAGVLVAIASKNEAALVERALARDDQLLRAEQVFPVFAHWNAKSESVRSILAAWNIGADTVVFVDDSEMELAEVKAQHPAVECLLFNKDDPKAVVELLARLRDLFGKPLLQHEDRLRRESLRVAASAAQLMTDAGGASEQFLASAAAEVTLDFRKDPSDTRAFELLNKTNQFNLNGRRYTEAEWRDHLERPGSYVLTVSYRDKFGALGKVAVLAGRSTGVTATVDSWVMSCRAFARRIEHQTLKALFDQLAVNEVALAFLETERNGPTRDFIAQVVGAPPSTSPIMIDREQFLARSLPTYHTVRTPSLDESRNA